MLLDSKTLKRNFSYHKPNEDDISKYTSIRHMALEFVTYINDTCPDSREKSLAITKIEEAVMWANASLARKGK